MHQPVLSGLVASALSTAAAGPLVRSWLHRRRRFDHPNERSSHTVPTPRGGGLACAAGAIVGAVASKSFGGGPSAHWIAATAVLGSVGRADDLTDMAPVPRLGVQVLVGTVAGARVGGLLGATVGAALVPVIVNAFNFMDGINGISGGTAAAWGAVNLGDRRLHPSGRAQAAIVAGMGLGFLPYNVPKASMFLGDVGSYLLGSGIAVTVLEGSFAGGKLDLCGFYRTSAPLALYLADTGGTVARRALRGEPVTQAHREHAYQRLVRDTGLPHWVVSGLVTVATTACGCASRGSNGPIAIAAIVILYLGSPALARFIGSRVDFSGLSMGEELS